jgi:polyisoprenoid-binding protein YceI
MLPLRTLLPLALLIALSNLHAGNFVLNTTKSTLAADVKASPPHSFTCTATTFQTDLQINPQTLEVTKAVCRFKFADIDSEKEKRDKKMRGWMNIEHYPEATFTLTSVKASDVAGEHIGVGQFTMHGVSREIEIPFTINREGKTIVLDGATEFDYTEWSLPVVRLLFFSVKPTLKPHFHLEGTLSNDA